MNILAIESIEALRLLLSAAIERARPGTRLSFATDAASAALTVEEAKRAGAALPDLAVIGPSAFGVIRKEDVSRIRRAIPAGIAIVALVQGQSGDRAQELEVDRCYPLKLHWDGCHTTVEQMMRDWSSQAGRRTDG